MADEIMAPKIAPVPPQPPAAFADLAQKATPAQEDAVIATLPDGRTVLLERPRGSTIARAMMVAADLVGEMEPGAGQSVALITLRSYVQALFYVRAIDGTRTPPIKNAEAYNGVANRLGDDGIEAVQDEIFKHWPPASMKDKEPLKKNLSGPDVP